MKRNVFGATIVAGGLALFTSVAGLADSTTGPAAEAAVSKCATEAKLTAPTTLTGEALSEATALKAEVAAGIAEVVTEANSNIKEAVAETTDEDGASAADLTAELTEIVNQSCKAIAHLQAAFNAGIAELVAGSTKVEQPEGSKNVEKQDVEKEDVEKPETEKHDSGRKHSEKRGSDREGND